MAVINTNSTTAPNGAALFNEIIYKKLFVSTALNKLFTLMEGQKHGKKVVVVKPFGLLGKKSEGCNPTYDNSIMPTLEKEWNIKEWQIAEKLCYDDLDGSIIEEVLNTGIDAANLIDTRYFKEIIEPGLTDAIERLITRLAFFGDTAITGDKLKTAGNTIYFNLIDGIWKQIFTGVTEGTISRTTIAANTQTTVSAQLSAMVPGSGTAVNLVNKIITDAPMALRQATNKVIYMTQALYDAYIADKQAKYFGSEGQWNSLENGMTEGKINGIDVVVVPDWDYNIQSFLKNTTNENANDNPFRAIFTTKDNLLLGTESEGNFKVLSYGFDEKEQISWVLAKNTLGALVAMDELTHVAF